MRRDDDMDPGGGERDPGGGRDPSEIPSSGITARQVIIVILVVLLVAFAAANFERVRVSFLLFDTQARVITVIAVAAGLGFVLGYFVGRPNREQRKRLAKND
jgi:uncharacterized integral membrane protein